MTAVRVLTNKWVLVLGAVAILGLTASQTLADPPGGGHYRSSPGWSHGGPGGYGHQVMPYRGEHRGERFGGGDRFGGYGRHQDFRPPIRVATPVYCPPRVVVPYSGGYVRSGGGLTVTIIIR